MSNFDIFRPPYAPLPSPSASTETSDQGWLVELQPGVFYRISDEDPELETVNPDDALRFARKVDAERVIRRQGLMNASATPFAGS